MGKPCLYDIGSGWIFCVEVSDNLSEIEDIILKSKLSAICISDLFNLPFSYGTMTIILYRVYSRSAYDLYHKLHGEHMRTCDPVVIQSILSSVGDSGKDKKIIHLEFSHERY